MATTPVVSYGWKRQNKDALPRRSSSSIETSPMANEFLEC